MGSDSHKTKAQLIDELALAKQRIIALEATPANHDLTKYNRINAELQKLEKQHSILLEKSNDGIIVLQDGLVKFANSKAAEITGFSAEAVLGKPFIDFVAPQYRELVMERYRKRLAGEDIPNKYEMGLLNKGGSIISVEVNASLIEYDGKPATLSMVRDITEHRAMEEKLKDSETRYRRLFETAQDAILILNGDTGQIIDANPVIKDLLGLSMEELIGKNLWEIGEFKDTLASKISYQELHESGYKRWDNLPLVTKDGRIISVEVVANSYQVDHTRVIQCNIRDMTVADLAVKTLKEIKQDLEIAQRLTGIGNWKWIIAANKLIWSEELCHINGWDPNLPVPPFAEMERFYTSESWERLNELVTKAFNTGEPYGCELEQIRTDGTSLITFSRGEADFDAGGKIIGLHGTVQDITEQKQSEDDLHRSGEFFEAVFNSTNDAIMVIDINDFTIVRANDAFLQQEGLKEGEVIGKTCYEVTHHRSDPCASLDDMCPLRETVATGGHSLAEHVHYTRDNEKIYVEVYTSPLKDESGKVTQVVHVSRDITERMKLQQQLMAQDRLASIGQLVSGVAHELNNPLTSVIGFSELLLQRELPDDVKADLKIVNDEAKRTSLIVKNLLTFARQQPQEKRVIDINESIQTVLQLRSHEQSVNNIKVNTHLAPDLPQIMGNSSQLQQVFFNIVANAEQAMLEVHKKGTLAVTTERVGNIVKARFTDDGPGISPENIRKLFTPFFTTKEIGKGTGLGLSICQGIVTEHGGRMYAKSGLGEGATFIIELPVPP